jgi:hypothetical protein
LSRIALGLLAVVLLLRITTSVATLRAAVTTGTALLVASSHLLALAEQLA